jgi:hypothetical protein
MRVSRICALRVNVPAGTEGESPLACFVDRLGSLHDRKRDDAFVSLNADLDQNIDPEVAQRGRNLDA